MSFKISDKENVFSFVKTYNYQKKKESTYSSNEKKWREVNDRNILTSETGWRNCNSACGMKRLQMEEGAIHPSEFRKISELSLYVNERIVEPWIPTKSAHGITVILNSLPTFLVMEHRKQLSIYPKEKNHY